MRRSIIKEFDQLGESLSNQSAQFAYRMKNLCVKAEEVALLPVEILIEGEFQKLESCATIGKKDDYSFMVFPNYEEDLETMAKGIFRVHPEFKQKIGSMQVDSVDEAGKNKSMDVHYILLTMPEVDDDRYDVLKDGVKVCYEECKARMEVLNRKADAKFAELTIGDTDEDVKKLKAAREKLNEQWYGHRDKLYNEKLQEIEEAHNKWLAERGEEERKRMEDEASHNDDVALSMRMAPEED
jgi:ribosome recycling factor